MIAGGSDASLPLPFGIGVIVMRIRVKNHYNKQSARYYAQLAKIAKREALLGGEEDVEEDDDY